MVWGALYLQELDDLPYIEGVMNSAFYQKILEENVRPSVWPQAQEHLGYAGGQLFQTHQQVQLNKKLIKVLEWPNQSPD